MSSRRNVTRFARNVLRCGDVYGWLIVDEDGGWIELGETDSGEEVTESEDDFAGFWT
jgi:hypothetical protein